MATQTRQLGQTGVFDDGGYNSLVGSIALPKTGGWMRNMLAYTGPGLMVSVGYMDPGNWGSDMAAGSKYGYSLLWVVLVSSLMAIVLQVLSARLGLATGRDLAQLSRQSYKKPVLIAMFGLCQLAIIACDLAEVIGSAVALKILLHIPLMLGVIINGFDVLLLLGLMKLGFRKLESTVIALVATVAGAYALEMVVAHPNMRSVMTGFIPNMGGGHSDYIFLALGIIGATVMPHNLYLHSSLVQTRERKPGDEGVKQAIKFNTIDTVVSLSIAFVVNAAILVLAGKAFHGMNVDDLEKASQLLAPMLGGAAAIAFALGLLASGQSSTITGTLAGQVVMEGFLKIKIAPWIQRIITRGLAIIPAALMIMICGENKTNMLLVVSQVVLSMQLPFAMFSLITFTSDKAKMGRFVSPLWLQAVAWGSGLIVTALNVKLLNDTIGTGWVIAGTVGIVLFAYWAMKIYNPKADASLANAEPTM